MRLDEPPDSPDDDGAQIIQLRPGQDAQDDDRRMVTKRKAHACQHTRVVLDRDVQRAFCRRCDQEVPLFDYLVSLAAGWERFIGERREAERRMRVVRENLSELLRDERNAKARRRNWRKYEPDAVRHLRECVGLLGQLAGRGHPTVAKALAFLDSDEDAGLEVRPGRGARP